MKMTLLLTMLLLTSFYAKADEPRPVPEQQIIQVNSQEEMDALKEKKLKEMQAKYSNNDLSDVNRTLKIITKLPRKAFVEGLDRASVMRITQNNYYTTQELLNLYRDNNLNPEAERGKGMYFSVPLDQEDLIKVLVASSLGVIIFNSDRDIMDAVQAHKNEYTRQVADFGNIMGTATGIAPIALGSYFIGFVYDNDKLKDIGLFTVTTALASQMVTESIKRLSGRERPRDTDDPRDFLQGGMSFPSGHTTGAFSLATVISEIYKEDYPVVPYIAYGIAAITAYARMHDQAHWASDVFIGAILSHLVTKYFIKYWKKYRRHQNAPKYWSELEVYPIISLERGYGIGFKMKL